MNARQKALLRDIIVVTLVTAIFVVAMMNVKNYLNRSEAILAMKNLGQIITQYHNKHGALPPEFHINKIKDEVAGSPRLGKIHYRASQIGFDADDDTIVAYAKKDYHSIFLSPGYVVLTLNGSVKWMEPEKFEAALTEQTSGAESFYLTNPKDRDFPPLTNPAADHNNTHPPH